MSAMTLLGIVALLLVISAATEARTARFNVNYKITCGHNLSYDYQIDLFQDDFYGDHHLAGPENGTAKPSDVVNGALMGSADGNKWFAAKYKLKIRVRHTCSQSENRDTCSDYFIAYCKFDEECNFKKNIELSHKGENC